MAVQVELYRHKEALESEQDPEAAHRRELVENLGFSPQLQLVDEVGNEAARFYPELTGYELEVWTLFHRSYYRKGEGEWSGYHFDRVPTDVLEEIRFAHEFGGLDDIELWTPERGRDLDPMAVGVVGHRLGDNQYWVVDDLGRNAAFNQNARFFPIVRWGESLMAFEEIVRQVVLSRFEFVTWSWKPRSEITRAIIDYAKPLFETNPRMQFKYGLAGRLSRHCKQRMIEVNDTAVCVACGAH